MIRRLVSDRPARTFASSSSEGLKKANLCGLLPRPAEAIVLPLTSRSR
jgi:hypothetical protein